MKSIATHSFRSPINREYSSSPVMTNLSPDTESTVELYEGNGCLSVEWCIEELELVEHIGLQLEFTEDEYGYEHPTKTINGYDGVFEVPAQIITWLESLGYNCKEIK